MEITSAIRNCGTCYKNPLYLVKSKAVLNSLKLQPVLFSFLFLLLLCAHIIYVHGAFPVSVPCSMSSQENCICGKPVENLAQSKIKLSLCMTVTSHNAAVCSQ